MEICLNKTNWKAERNCELRQNRKEMMSTQRHALQSKAGRRGSCRVHALSSITKCCMWPRRASHGIYMIGNQFRCERHSFLKLRQRDRLWTAPREWRRRRYREPSESPSAHTDGHYKPRQSWLGVGGTSCFPYIDDKNAVNISRRTRGSPFTQRLCVSPRCQQGQGLWETLALMTDGSAAMGFSATF